MSRHVLLVEDNFLAALEVRAVLEAMDWSVIGPAATCAEAIQMLDDGPPVALALLDVRLRDGDCREVVARLRGQGTPHALLTGYAEPDLEALGAAPTTRIISKPVSAAKLKTVVEDLLTSG